MIRFSSVSKSYHPKGGDLRVVLDDVTIEFPRGKNVGVFGLNGAGKSTLIRLLSGSEMPDSGSIVRKGLTSFPLGFSSIFHPDLSGKENIEFVARIYGLSRKYMFDFVEDFSELGSYLHSPVKTYSSGMVAKLAFGACLAVDFDTYLIDEITEVGDGRFREKALRVFRERMLEVDMIVVSHNIDTIREYCNVGAIIHDGKIIMYDSVSEASNAFTKIMRGS